MSRTSFRNAALGTVLSTSTRVVVTDATEDASGRRYPCRDDFEPFKRGPSGWEVRYDRARDRYVAFVRGRNLPVVRYDKVWRFYSVAAAQQAIAMWLGKE